METVKPYPRLAPSLATMYANVGIIPLHASAKYDNQVFTASLANFCNLRRQPSSTVLHRLQLCVIVIFNARHLLQPLSNAGFAPANNAHTVEVERRETECLFR